MSKLFLWSIDNNGNIYSLSSWSNSWQHINCPVSKINKFKVVAGTSWCTWAIGTDNELYLYIPKSDVVIRTSEVIIENQRKISGLFASKFLKPQDPSEYTTPNYYGKLLKTDFKSFKLPSSRWKWENDWKIRNYFNGQLTNEGWIYSSNFHRRFQVERFFLASHVRRRFWQRYRGFHAFDRWLYVAQDSQPFEISCGQDCCNESVTTNENVEISSTGILDIGCGGEMLPHQKDGFLSVWIVNSIGQILFRLNVHRQNPEGSNWCNVKLPKSIKAKSLAVSPLGNLFVCTFSGDIYFRENITWKNPLGTTWRSFELPTDLWMSERITHLSICIYNIWARSDLGRVWLRCNVNLHEANIKLALGDVWTLVATGVSYISTSGSEQLFGISSNGNSVLYKTGKLKTVAGKNYWTGKLPMDVPRLVENSEKFVSISGSGLFLEDDILPVSWIQSPLNSHKMYNKEIDLEGGWKIKILQSLKIRDNSEFKNPRFANYISSFEQTSWSKASECQVQYFSLDNDRKVWLPASIIMHHKIRNNGLNATIHVNTKNANLFDLDCILFFIDSSEVICVSKFYNNSTITMTNNAELDCSMIIFVKNRSLSMSPKTNTDVSKMMLKFSTESDVEDWIMAVNFVSLTEKGFIDKSFSGRAWFLNKFYEPFSSYMRRSDDHTSKWHQDGGHFHIVKSGAKGYITWALGFNGIAWTHSKGWGGSYLGVMCSSKEELYPVYDSRPVYVIEFQKLKVLPGQMCGEYLHYMWTDDAGNLIRDKESVQLPSKRWHWYDEWSICLNKNKEREGWQYSTGMSQEFDDYITWTKIIRRRKWTRTYKTTCMGPWKEVKSQSIKISDISIFPGVECGEERNDLVLAVSNKHCLLLRKGVTINRPEGLSWLPLKSKLKMTSVAINNNGTVWVTCIYGFIWRLRFTSFRDITRIDENDWETLRHPSMDGKFIEISSGDNLSLWAIDKENHLWVRQFENDIHVASIGVSWIYVCDNVLHVSCASHLLVWVVFLNGYVAERSGITAQLPQGTDWTFKFTGIATHISIHGA